MRAASTSPQSALLLQVSTWSTRGGFGGKRFSSYGMRVVVLSIVMS